MYLCCLLIVGTWCGTVAPLLFGALVFLFVVTLVVCCFSVGLVCGLIVVFVDLMLLCWVVQCGWLLTGLCGMLWFSDGLLLVVALVCGLLLVDIVCVLLFVIVVVGFTVLSLQLVGLLWLCINSVGAVGFIAA